MSKGDLGNARKAKKDEFYTQLSDIEKEMRYYRSSFEDKVVFCNCDDPFESNFFKYFAMNFNFLKLKKLICTCYAGSPVSHTEFNDLPLFRKNTSEKMPYMIQINEVNDQNGDGAVDMTDIEILLKNDKNLITILDGDGDFRSEESIMWLKEADIVVTNPPFSLFREFVAQLIEYDKKFLIIGNVNAITYKEFFPLIRENKVWMGASIHSGDREFQVPDSYPLNASGCRIDENGKKFIRVKGVRWWTNLDYKERHEDMILYAKYSPEKYPKYDNYNAINVDVTKDIPCDYGGVMGVPITFLDKYNPEQFEIVSFRKGDDGKDLVFTREREREFNRTFVSLYDEYCRNDKKCRGQDKWETYLCAYHNQKEKGVEIEPVELVYPISSNLKNGMINNQTINGKKGYCRMLIRRKTNEN